MEVNKQIRHPILTPSKNIDFGVLMGHVQQLPWTGLVQWGNGGTYILIRYFVIFFVILEFFVKLLDFFPPNWKKEDCLLYK